MNETRSRDSRWERLKVFAGLLVVVFTVTLAAIIGDRLSDESFGDPHQPAHRRREPEARRATGAGVRAARRVSASDRGCAAGRAAATAQRLEHTPAIVFRTDAAELYCSRKSGNKHRRQVL